MGRVRFLLDINQIQKSIELVISSQQVEIMLPMLMEFQRIVLFLHQIYLMLIINQHLFLWEDLEK